MTTHKIEVAHESLVKQKFNWLLAIGIFIVGLGLGAFVTTLPIAKIEIGLQPVAEAENMASRQRAIEAEAARYTSLGLFYAAGNEANVQRGIEAEAARYNAMAKFYLTEDGVNTQRAIEAEAARYNGLADFYGPEDGANSLAWPPRPTQFHIAENTVMPITENALAAYHQSERDFTSIVTSRIQENALDAYHQSEWGRTPSAVLPSEEDALAAYHQSEWGRPLSPGLPSAKHETEADQDIGLMDFSPGVNEVGRQPHDREYGLATVSNLPESDADQDIGLMESFVAPDETSQQGIDPADRKFFSPGYGAMSGGSEEVEALPTIDPADRKFFSPGYGAQTVISREAEALPTIDPADRKFFNPGYGAQTSSAKRSEAVLPPIENKMGEWSAVWFLLK